VFYLHPDHLGTPRAATRSVAVAGATTGPNAINKATWRWESDPFGTSLNASAPNGNPQNVTGTAGQITAASFRVNNRFPGQVFDAESAKSYNYFRDYDSAIGRYSESDPIGLRGGVNTFGYVRQQPIRSTDPRGLVEWNGGSFTLGAMLYAGEMYQLTSECVNGKQAFVEVKAVGGGLGFGWSVAGSNSTFQDGLSHVNPHVFNGAYSKTGFGAALGIGGQCQRVNLGGAWSEWGCGVQGGIDYSVGFTYGTSYVTFAKVSDCGCRK